MPMSTLPIGPASRTITSKLVRGAIAAPVPAGAVGGVAVALRGTGRRGFLCLAGVLVGEHHEGIEHRLITPRKPQTNGMVERFNGRIAAILNSTHFANSKQLEATMKNYSVLYNHYIPQQNIGTKPPIEAMREWQRKKPELFKRPIPNSPGRDS